MDNKSDQCATTQNEEPSAFNSVDTSRTTKIMRLFGTKKWVGFLVSTLISALIATVLSVGATYFWEQQRIKTITMVIMKDISQQIDYLSTFAIGGNTPSPFQINEDNLIIKIQNLLLPSTSIWGFYESNYFIPEMSTTRSLPINSLFKLTIYHRFAKRAKDKSDQCRSNLYLLFKEGVPYRGVQELLSNADNNEINDHLQQIYLANLTLEILHLRESIYFTVTAGYEALATLSEEVLIDGIKAKKYRELADHYKRLAYEESSRNVQAIHEAEKETNKYIIAIYKQLPNISKETIKSILFKYGKVKLPTH